MEAAIDDPQLLENLSGELSYRLGLTLNSLVRITADTASGVDSAAKITLAEDSELTAANIRTAAQSLVGVNARPLFADGYFGGVIHPFVVQDVLNDTTANGLTDILKRSESGAQKLMALPQNDAVIEFAGVKFKQSTTCPTSTINTKTFYNTYIFADDAIFSVFLGKSPDGQKNFNLKINVAPENGSVADPARVIGGWVAYNVN